MKKILLPTCFSALLFNISVAQNCPPLNPTNDNTGIAGDLILSEINPGDFIELYNTTNSDIALSSIQHQLCSPFNYIALSTLASSVVVPANGYATVPWPANFNDTNAGGEVILYKNSSFSNSSNIIDFVCWGTNPHGSRKSQAESVGKWQSGSSCAGALLGGSIHRIASTNGTSASSYNTTSASSPLNCTSNLCTGVNCDDGDACTADSCDNVSGCVNTVIVCNDLNPCTIDNCDPLTGCTTTPINCDDNNVCTVDTCSGSGCVSLPVSCDDNDACTDDNCQPLSGCTTTPINCDDGNSCTTDGCDPLTGCTYVAVGCNDGNACTADSCDATGCLNTAIVCGDGNVCNGTETCDPVLGCQPGTPLVCNDGNACTDEVCNPTTGCFSTPVVCDDTDNCTTDGCDSISGCFFLPLDCNDADSCTIDSCAGGQCFNTLISECGINAMEEIAGGGIAITVFLNPSGLQNQLNFQFILRESSQVRLEIFDGAGRRLAVLFDGFVTSSYLQNIKYQPKGISHGMIIFRLQTERETYYGRALMVQ